MTDTLPIYCGAVNSQNGKLCQKRVGAPGKKCHWHAPKIDTDTFIPLERYESPSPTPPGESTVSDDDGSIFADVKPHYRTSHPENHNPRADPPSHPNYPPSLPPQLTTTQGQVYYSPRPPPLPAAPQAQYAYHYLPPYPVPPPGLSPAMTNDASKIKSLRSHIESLTKRLSKMQSSRDTLVTRVETPLRSFGGCHFTHIYTTKSGRESHQKMCVRGAMCDFFKKTGTPCGFAHSPEICMDAKRCPHMPSIGAQRAAKERYKGSRRSRTRRDRERSSTHRERSRSRERYY